ANRRRMDGRVSEPAEDGADQTTCADSASVMCRSGTPACVLAIAREVGRVVSGVDDCDSTRPVCLSSIEPVLPRYGSFAQHLRAPGSTRVMTNVVHNGKRLWQLDGEPHVPSKPTTTPESWSGCGDSRWDQSSDAGSGGEDNPPSTSDNRARSQNEQMSSCARMRRMFLSIRTPRPKMSPPRSRRLSTGKVMLN
ncbi:MAG: hypothetical protein M1823_005421, partial [Watsoniomyces obsoletus]